MSSRTFHFKISDPELLKRLERFEDEVEIAEGSVLTYCNLHNKRSYLESTVILRLTRKPQPDWEKLQLLVPGWWLAMDNVGTWYLHENRPSPVGNSWVGEGGILSLSRLNRFVLPNIPYDRWEEACWQVPNRAEVK